MAIFGNLQTLIDQTKGSKFIKVFDYLTKILNEDSDEYKRLFSYKINDCMKIELDDNFFVLEQVYITKDRNDCFFESHKKYIDVQFIFDGEEQIEVENISKLETKCNYDDNLDLIKYHDYDLASKIILKSGDAIILFPEDGHMPSLKVNEPSKVLKVVVKLKVDTINTNF